MRGREGGSEGGRRWRRRRRARQAAPPPPGAALKKQRERLAWRELAKTATGTFSLSLSLSLPLSPSTPPQAAPPLQLNESSVACRRPGPWPPGQWRGSKSGGVEGEGAEGVSRMCCSELLLPNSLFFFAHVEECREQAQPQGGGSERAGDLHSSHDEVHGCEDGGEGGRRACVSSVENEKTRVR